jgi:type IX secretion system PorP/SprF family membrane protein
MIKGNLRNLATLVLLSIGISSIAQQDPQFSQNMNNKLFVNPAFAGMNDGICGYMIGRHQWSGFEGRPETYVFGAHGTFTTRILNMRSGGGLTIVGDGLGQQHFFGLKGQYSLHIPLSFIGGNPGHLGIGASVGLLQFSMGNNWRSTDPYFSDPSIPDEGYSEGGFDMDLGLFYQTDLAMDRKLYFGVSIAHVNGREFSGEGNAFETEFPNNPVVTAWDTRFKMYRHIYVMAGFDYPIPGNELFVLKPSVLVKSDAVTAQFDVNLNVEWNNFLWGGVGYRAVDAAVVMAGLRSAVPGVPGTFTAGYSYDVTTSRINKGSAGSHEIFIQYCFKLKPQPPVSQHRDVRFL